MKKFFLVFTFALIAFTSRSQEAFLGEIRLVAFPYAPRGWALCNGQVLPIVQYQALYAILGTVYGGDGRSTFALPDLRGRLAVHPNGNTAGGINVMQGERGGASSQTLRANNIPLGITGLVGVASKDSGTKISMVSSIAPQPLNTTPPFLGVYYIICLNGYFPTRE
jgi:microcystin-dependent protein